MVTNADGSGAVTFCDAYLPLCEDMSHTTGPFGNISSTAFPTVTVADETGRKRQTVSDALGRLTEVYEPNPPGSGSLTSGSLHTQYVYDVLNNLTQVTQSGDRSGSARVRPFTYDSLSRLLDATSP